MTKQNWMTGLRVLMVAIVAIGTVAIASPQAEAKKNKIPVDPSTFATSFLGDLDALFGALEANADTLAARMAEDIDAALESGKLKQILKLDARYEKLIRNELKNYEKYAAQGLKQAAKVFKKISADPQFSAQIQQAVNAALAQLESVQFDLRDHLSDLIDEAIAELESQTEG